MSIITELRTLLANATVEPAAPTDIHSIAVKIKNSIPGSKLTIQRNVRYPKVERSPAYIIDVIPVTAMRPLATIYVATLQPRALGDDDIGEITADITPSSTQHILYRPSTVARFFIASTGKIYSANDPAYKKSVNICAFFKEWYEKLHAVDKLCKDKNFDKAAIEYSLLANLHMDYAKSVLENLYQPNGIATGSSTETKLQTYMDAATSAGLHRQPGNSYVFTESGDMRVPGLTLVFTGSETSPKATLSYNGKSERSLRLSNMPAPRLKTMLMRIAKHVNAAKPNSVSTTHILATVEPGYSLEDRMRKYGLDPKLATIRNGIILEYRGDVDLSNKNLTKIPFRFVKVTGAFDCSRNQLTSLVGCPKEVDGNFWCEQNKLTSLVGCPKEVGGNFVCYNNPGSTSFKKPSGVKEDFYSD